jgi:CheY-like chemotaxis protein
MMPVMSGAELLEIIREDDQLARIPIIIVSAWPEEAARPAVRRRS